MITNRNEAYLLLKKLGAQDRLLMHARLVGEAADELMQVLSKLGVEFDTRLVELGAILHDAGKIPHPEELTGPGMIHGLAGEKLLLAHGIPPRLARCCVTHSAWRAPDVSYEEKLVALADRLWRGKRDEILEQHLIEETAVRMGKDKWEVFLRLDSVFERIADGGAERLQRSQGGPEPISGKQPDRTEF